MVGLLKTKNLPKEMSSTYMVLLTVISYCSPMPITDFILFISAGEWVTESSRCNPLKLLTKYLAYLNKNCLNTSFANNYNIALYSCMYYVENKLHYLRKKFAVQNFLFSYPFR
jgi:hypothetical protein